MKFLYLPPFNLSVMTDPAKKIPFPSPWALDQTTPLCPLIVFPIIA